MEERYIKAISDSPKWIRPAGWLTMPTITSVENKLAFLFAVYENEENCFSLNYGSAVCNYTVDWGDGTSINVINTTTITEKRYDYSAISSIVLQDELGINYKQVIITVTLNSGTITGWVIGSVSSTIGAPGNRPGKPQVLEAIISHTHGINFSSRISWPLLQSIKIVKLVPIGTVSSFFNGLISLRNFEGFENINTTNTTTSTNTFNSIGSINSINITWNSGIAGQSTMFSNSTFKKLGNINLQGSGGLGSVFASCFILTEVGTVNTNSHNTLTNLFNSNYNLRKIGTITVGGSAIVISSMFSGCYSIEEIEFTNCANIITTTTAFLNCLSLRKLIMPNMSVSFSVVSCNLQRQVIIDLLNSLGSPLITQNIVLTSNPGMIDLTNAEIMAILTPKNWTYTA